MSLLNQLSSWSPLERLAPGTRWGLLSIGFLLVLSTAVVTEFRMGTSPLPLMVALIAVTLPVLLWGAFRHGIDRPSRSAALAAGSFAALMAYALISGLVSEQRIGGAGEELVTLSKAWVVSVPLQGLGVCLIALLAVSMARAKDLPYALWLAAVAGAVLTPLGWLLNHEAPGGRLATRVGGAAVLHVALLIGLAIALAAWRDGRRPRVSLAVAAAYVGYLVLSGSRAGMISLVAFVVLLAGGHLLRKARARHLPLRAWGLVGLGAVLLGAAVALVFGQRSYDPLGGGRLETWSTGLGAATASAGTIVFGTGFGTLWPWHAFEQGSFQADAGPVKAMPHGETLAHAHSLYVAVAAELGVLGLILLAPVLVAVVWSFLSATSPLGRLLGAALVATLAGFAFDTYLIKNFPVSLIWWLTLFAALRLSSGGGRADERGSGSGDGGDELLGREAAIQLDE